MMTATLNFLPNSVASSAASGSCVPAPVSTKASTSLGWEGGRGREESGHSGPERGRGS